MKNFPFPNRENSMEDLARDAVYNRIPVQDREHVCDIGWQHGIEVAQKIIEEYGDAHIEKIEESKGLKVIRLDKDKVAGGLRYFSEFFEKAKEIKLYTKAVEQFATANKLKYADAEELILAHEFYHYLECYEIGNTARLYTVAYHIGNFKFMKSGIRALSEISANAFARVYWENKHGAVNPEQGTTVHNWVLSDTKPYEGREYADKFMGFVFGKNYANKHSYNTSGANNPDPVIMNKPLKKK